MIVNVSAYGRLRWVGSGGHPSRARARAVKYMANRPAKNISSLESQMIVPTLTRFGRVRECTREVSKVLLARGAVVTRPIMASLRARSRPRGAMSGRRRDLPDTESPRCRVGAPTATTLGAVSNAAPATVLVYSSRPDVRAAVRTAVGRRPAADVGPLTWVECATGEDVVDTVDAGGVDLCILDGEAQPTGGLALARQLTGEVADRPAL